MPFSPSTSFSGLSALIEKLSALKDSGLKRELTPFKALNGVMLTDAQDRTLIDFSGNDYLGFSQHPTLISAAQGGLEAGLSTTSSRLIRGSFTAQQHLEDDLARFCGSPAALVYNTGYQANVGLLSALINRNDTVFSDRLNHASIVDGLQLSRAKITRYPHLDTEQLEAGLKKACKEAPDTPRWIISETVFSMDGDCAPLAELFELSQRYGAWLVLDEAHAVGLFGDKRRSGLWETIETASWPDNLIVVGTFSKALGSYGGYIAAAQAVIDTLINSSRSFIYSTALPLSIIAANHAAIRLLQDDPSLTQTLWQRADLLSQLLTQPANSAIIPIIIGDNDSTLRLAQQLVDEGFYLKGIRPPTVPEGTARLRLTLSANHTPEHITQLVAALQQHLN